MQSSSSAILKNIFLLDNKGKTYFSKNYHGELLDASLLLGFSSSILNLSTKVFNEPLTNLESSHGRLIYHSLGKFMLVAQTDIQVGLSLIRAMLQDISKLLVFLFGSHEHWDQDVLELTGLQDVFNLYFAKPMYDPTVIVGGLQKTLLSETISERLDHLLRGLETDDALLNNSSLLIIGQSVLHSRLGLEDTRMLLQYVRARPLGSSSVRYTPVFVSGAWRNLYLVKTGAYTLGALTYIDKPFASLLGPMEEFRIALTQSRLEIPVEEPPLLLRLFAKRDTLALLYHNIKTGQTLFPQLRPGPEIQQKEILDTFWSFFAAQLDMVGVQVVSIGRDQYRFYACKEGIHRLYLFMSAESVSYDSVPLIASEILKNVIKSLAGIE